MQYVKTYLFSPFVLMLLSFLLIFPQVGSSQDKATKKKSKSGTTQVEQDKSAFDTVSLAGFKFRSIGPALTSGRISEVAVDPNNHSRYFVAASAGGVWRTLNAGLTFDPVFDTQGTSSIGTVVIDQGNPSEHDVMAARILDLVPLDVQPRQRRVQGHARAPEHRYQGRPAHPARSYPVHDGSS